MKPASILVLSALVVAGCSAQRAAPTVQEPVAAAEAFSHALQEGDGVRAWELLSSRTQAAADRLAARARLSPDGGPDSGRAMLLGGAYPLGATSSRELSSDGGAAEVAISLDGGAPQTFRAVHEPSGWKIDLDLE